MGALRLFLAVCVAYGHSGLLLFGVRLIDPFKAVMVFFAISGFLITYVLQAKYCHGAWRKTFWINRALRIYPAYLTMLALTIAAGIAGIVDLGYGYGRFGSPLHNLITYFDGATPLTRAILWGSNVTTLGLDAMRALRFDPSTGSLVLQGGISGRGFALMGQAWTLGTELLFYALAPFIVRRIETIAAALLLCAALSVTRLPIVFPLLIGDEVGFAGENGYGYLPFFLAGAAMCHAWRGTWRELSVALGALLFLAVIEQRDIFYAVFIVAAVTALAPLFSLTRRWALDSFLGELSYPVYITHFLLLQAMVPRVEAWPAWAAAAAYYGAVLIASLLMVVVIERPVHRLRQRVIVMNERQMQQSAAALVAD
jgi:peptidoglycan/LPS O-acetylase OafA/YrhL